MLLSAIFMGLYSLFILVFCILGPLVGGVGGLNQVNLRVEYIIKWFVLIVWLFYYLFILQLKFKIDSKSLKIKFGEL